MIETVRQFIENNPPVGALAALAVGLAFGFLNGYWLGLDEGRAEGKNR